MDHDHNEKQLQPQQQQPLPNTSDRSIRQRPTTIATAIETNEMNAIDNEEGYHPHSRYHRLRHNMVLPVVEPSLSPLTTNTTTNTTTTTHATILKKLHSNVGKRSSLLWSPRKPPIRSQTQLRSQPTMYTTTTNRNKIQHLLQMVCMIVLLLILRQYRSYWTPKSLTLQQSLSSSSSSGLANPKVDSPSTGSSNHNNNKRNKKNRRSEKQLKRVRAKQQQQQQQRATKMNDRKYPLLQFPIDLFPSLQQIILQHQSSSSSSSSSSTSSTKLIIGLYFAASWCPMSTPTTQLLDDTFRSYLLHQPTTQPAAATVKESSLPPPSTTFKIVYVSSDETIESFQSYLRPGWDSIPYHIDNELIPERDRIKQFFHTCAKREIQQVFQNHHQNHNHIQLDSERWYEIPHLIILNATVTSISLSSQFINVITYHGLPHVQRYGIDAIPYWTQSFS